MIREALLIALSGVVASHVLVALGRAIAGRHFNRALHADAARLRLYVQPAESSDSARARRDASDGNVMPLRRVNRRSDVQRGA
ncbi:MAG: hypothetical protein QOF28_2620 [Actinomycetota bacterium]|jgi:hypothetical protein|nr:hypothetical protein [Actinomycetota bacterium]